MLVILIDVLHTVGPHLNVSALLLTVTAVLPAEEDGQGGEEPDVTQESHGELDRVDNITQYVDAGDHGHDEERGEDREHPHSGPELSFFSPKLLPQTETNQGDQGDGAVGQS